MPGVEAMLNTAVREIGYRETGTNLTRYNEWLGKIPGYPHGGHGYPWCSSFLSWCLEQSGNAGAGPRTAGCEAGVLWFKAKDSFHRTPTVGDFVYYGPRGGTHVELVIAVSKTSITTVGGNTSGTLDGRFHNGDGVYRKTVDRDSDRIYGYGRPLYPARPKPTKAKPTKLPQLQPGDHSEHVITIRRALDAANQASAVYDPEDPDLMALVHQFKTQRKLGSSLVWTAECWAALKEKP